MGVKIYRLPDEVPYAGYDFKLGYEGNIQLEKDHSAALRKHYEDMGYTGPNTGKVYREPVADGQAQYMVFEAPRGSNFKEKFFLIHLPYVDGYQARNVGFLTKTEIIKRLNFQDRFASLFK